MALNDPNWGRRGDGPPDLDEIWNRFRQKLPGLFGGKGAGREPGGGGRSFPGGAWLLIVLVAVIWLASGFYIVDASQRGVVLRFGKYLQTTEPG
jgi:membrane protease subunit HflK